MLYIEAVKLLDKVQKRARTRLITSINMTSLIKEFENSIDPTSYLAIDGGTIGKEQASINNFIIDNYKTTLMVCCKNNKGELVIGIQRCTAMITDKPYAPFYFPLINRGIWVRLTEGPFLDIERFANAPCTSKIVLRNNP
jgi:hypothetical protein